MKRTIAVIAIALLFALSLPAESLSQSIQKTSSWTASNGKNVDLRAYDDSGKLDQIISGNAKIDLDAQYLSLTIRTDEKTLVFAVDSWVSENGHYAVITRDGHTILFVDWVAVSNPKTKTPSVKVYGLHN